MSVSLRKPRRGGAGVTVKDVALQAGVSAMTVSRALNRPGSVDAAMEARVREAVDALGYVPNRMASSLRGSQTRLVAAVFPTLGGPVFLQLIDSLGQHLAAMGHQLLVGQSGYRDSREDDLLNDVISRRPDGIVLTGVAHTEGSRRRLQASGIPVVETWDLTLDPIGLLVGFSHEAVGRSVCDFFHLQGRRSLAYLGGHDARSLRRAAAFTSRAESLSLACQAPRFIEAPGSVSGGRGLLREALAADPKTDAVFCSSDFVALGVITEARELGLRVPEDLSVMGFGDLSVAQDVSPSISTVRIDTDRIGLISATWIVEGRLPGGLEGMSVDVGFSLVERDSTCAGA